MCFAVFTPALRFACTGLSKGNTFGVILLFTCAISIINYQFSIQLLFTPVRLSG
jgi:hypothetical protein